MQVVQEDDFLFWTAKDIHGAESEEAVRSVIQKTVDALHKSGFTRAQTVSFLKKLINTRVVIKEQSHASTNSMVAYAEQVIRQMLAQLEA